MGLSSSKEETESQECVAGLLSYLNSLILDKNNQSAVKGIEGLVVSGAVENISTKDLNQKYPICDPTYDLLFLAMKAEHWVLLDKLSEREDIRLRKIHFRLAISSGDEKLFKYIFFHQKINLYWSRYKKNIIEYILKEAPIQNGISFFKNALTIFKYISKSHNSSLSLHSEVLVDAIYLSLSKLVFFKKNGNEDKSEPERRKVGVLLIHLNKVSKKHINKLFNLSTNNEFQKMTVFGLAVILGNLDICGALLHHPGIDPNIPVFQDLVFDRNWGFYTPEYPPLLITAMSGNVVLTEYLLQDLRVHPNPSVKARVRDGEGLVRECEGYGILAGVVSFCLKEQDRVEIMELLLPKYVPFLFEKGQIFSSAGIAEAIKSGLIKNIHGASYTPVCLKEKTALNLLLRHFNTISAQEINKQDIECPRNNLSAKITLNLLSFSIRWEDEELFNLCMNHPGIELEKRDLQGYTALHHAILKGNLRFVEKLKFALFAVGIPKPSLPKNGITLRELATFSEGSLDVRNEIQALFIDEPEPESRPAPSFLCWTFPRKHRHSQSLPLLSSVILEDSATLDGKDDCSIKIEHDRVARLG